MNLKNIALCFSLGRAYGLGLAWALRQSLAQDADRWITVKPNGPDDKGTPVKLDAETGEVKAGMGGKFNGKHISAVVQRGRNEEHGAQAKIDRAKAIESGWEPKKKEPEAEKTFKSRWEMTPEEREADNQGWNVQKQSPNGVDAKIDLGDGIGISVSQYRGMWSRVQVTYEGETLLFGEGLADIHHWDGLQQILHKLKPTIEEIRGLKDGKSKNKPLSEMSGVERAYDERFWKADLSTPLTHLELEESTHTRYDKFAETVRTYGLWYRDGKKYFGNREYRKIVIPKEMPRQVAYDIFKKHLGDIERDSYRKEANAIKKAYESIKKDIIEASKNYPKYKYQIEAEKELEEARAERDRQAELGANSTRTLKNTLSEDSLKFVNDALSSAPEHVATVWHKFADDKIHVVNTEYEGTAFFRATDGGLSMNAKKVFDEGDDDVKGGTLFHEAFHNIDWLNAEGEDQYFSYNYKNNLFGKTIASEVKAFINDKAEQLDAIFQEDRVKFLEMFKDSLPPSTITKIRFHTTNKVTPAIATSILKNQMRKLKPIMTRSISDIFHGATKGKVHFGAGHFDKGYWDDGTNSPIEAFAELASTSIANKEAYNLIETILPKTVAVFNEMMTELSKRDA